ncbi:MAG: hypothetical protein BWZ08_01157 [candidate division BRC1 bacterium ADurb.BinA292]|nr:MAG: hypothetical protein BWZ08_01157 [candidate division BRC1 bacterium ADurb.BinA292]
MARWFIVAGVLLIALGLILHYAPWMLRWFGRLPGDIRIETEGVKVYIPIATMIVVSLLLTLLLHLLKR